jgi:phosphatidylglycerol:prolipoprotein diacylglycerol transferase
MFPILLEWGPITLRTYGLLVALAFLAGLRLARAAARLRRIPESFLLDATAIAIVSGLVGARLLYVFLNAGHFRAHPLEIFKLWEGGLVFYGGFLLAAAVVAWYCRRKKISITAMADCAAPALALGQAVGRWGCFFAGCCYGKPTSAPWAVRFQEPASLAPLGIDLHPVQVYESIGNLFIALFLWTRLSRHREEHGDVFWWYVLLYGALRFAMELLRGDERGPLLGGLAPSQFIAMSAVLVAGSILIAKKTTPHDAHA